MLKPWGHAFEVLRKRRGWSQGELVRAIRRIYRDSYEPSEYSRMCHSGKDGPSFMMIDAVLTALGYHWADFADALKQASHEQLHAAEKIATYQARKKGAAR